MTSPMVRKKSSLDSTDAKAFEKHGWVTGDNLWRVGFALGAVSLISWMSGLVDVYSVEYDGYGNLLFYLRSKDSTCTLFVNGVLRATKVERFKPPPQPVWVEALDYAVLNAQLS